MKKIFAVMFMATFAMFVTISVAKATPTKDVKVEKTAINFVVKDATVPPAVTNASWVETTRITKKTDGVINAIKKDKAVTFTDSSPGINLNVAINATANTEKTKTANATNKIPTAKEKTTATDTGQQTTGNSTKDATAAVPEIVQLK